MSKDKQGYGPYNKLVHDRASGRWSSTTYNHHIDAAKDLLASGGYTMDSIAHALIALALIQREDLERGR